ncbi:MAG: MBL fold metallo-hydrolase [Alistipes sp.]|nr:MBL fold metallo-hydrolase [Alistipes sp.]MBO7315318.1 MBL fold metallo-hydrolase [Alistipes sp.]MBR2435951.1 MBL fold metallo-hydrolase [Alistipes sp.]MBR3893248.1 MBL fold metallo-hydrolase [Alistipes sp.]
MNIAKLVFNPIMENTYIVWDDTKECIIIDAGNFSAREDAQLTDFISERGLKPVMAVNTHGHFDHAMGVGYLKETYGVKFACSSKDQFLVDSAQQSGAMFGVKCAPVPAIDIDLDKMDEIAFGATKLRVIKTPGHTPGHVSLYNEEQKVLFTGDTLFRESIGRTDLPGGDYSWIMTSILEQLVPLGDDVEFYPGHGDKSTIGHETLYNPFVTEVLNNEINYKG